MFDFIYLLCIIGIKTGNQNWNAKIQTIPNPGNIYLIFQIFDSTQVYLER